MPWIIVVLVTVLLLVLVTVLLLVTPHLMDRRHQATMVALAELRDLYRAQERHEDADRIERLLERGGYD